MGRPRKNPNAAMIAKDPLDSKAADMAVEGAMLKQVVREKSLDDLDRSIVLTSLGQFAREQFSVKNFPIRELQFVSMEPSDWGVTYYYPISRDQSGKIVPTYVDAPQNKRQMEVCKKKAEWFKKKGLRYFILEQSVALTPKNIREIVSPGSMESMTNENHVEAL